MSTRNLGILMSLGEVVQMKDKLDRPSRGKGITVEVTEDERKNFKALANSLDSDMSKLLRKSVQQYLASDPQSARQSAEAIRRAELHDHILDKMREFAASRRNDIVFLSVIEEAIGLNKGTFATLLQD